MNHLHNKKARSNYFMYIPVLSSIILSKIFIDVKLKNS